MAVISPGAVIASVLPVYLLIIAGAVLRRTGVIRQEHDAGVMRVVFSVMLPCFILDKILGAAVLRVDLKDEVLRVDGNFALLLFLGAPFLRIKFGNPDDRVLPTSARTWRASSVVVCMAVAPNGQVWVHISQPMQLALS